jgi:aminocarboxymuconate-semialdehyde decarboxylase
MTQPFKIDFHTHILPKNWPNLKEKYGYGGWVQLDHCGHKKAKMMIDGKLFREIEDNCWSPEVLLRIKKLLCNEFFINKFLVELL